MGDPQEITDNDYDRIRAVKQTVEATLLQKANVVGVGIGFVDSESDEGSELGIVVMVSRKLPVDLLRPVDVLPTEIDGIPILVREVGELAARDENDS